MSDDCHPSPDELRDAYINDADPQSGGYCEDCNQPLAKDESELGLCAKCEAHREKIINHARRIYRSEDCDYCEAHKNDSMMPPHQASATCESGKYNHCTCDTCY